MQKYSIVIPSYKEADNLRIILPAIKTALNQKVEEAEIIVVDTKTQLDNTKEICLNNGVFYLNRRPTDCYGDAVRAGIEGATGQWIIFMDADGSHAPEFILRLIDLVDDSKCDIGVASRYVKGGGSENGAVLVGMSKILNAIYAKLLKIKCLDISTSFKIYRASYLKSIHLSCCYFDVIEEMLFNLSKKYPDLIIKETPYGFKKRLYGKSKRSTLLFIGSYFFTLLKLYKNKCFNS